jgi:hypothetical protein
MRIAVRYAREHRETLRVLQAAVVKNGGLDPARRSTQLVPFLGAMEAWLGAHQPLAPGELRLRVQTLILLVGRYAIGGADEITCVVGTSDFAAAEQAVEDHLATIAVRLLLPS